jgi:hypothetical protein
MASPASSSSSSSTSSSPIHHASLVDPALHSPALLELVDVKVSRQVIEYTIDRVVETVDYAMGRAAASSSRGRSATRRPEHAKFTTFVSDVLTRAEVTMPTLLAALVYIDRARPHLHIGLEQWALERVFLGALIVASKYLNDSTLKNVHWAMCTGVFGKRDVGRIEREYLDVLNFELKITEDDLLSHHQGLAEAVPLSPRHKQPVELKVHVELPTYSPASSSSSSLSPDYSHKHTERRHTRRRSPTTSVSKVPELSPSNPHSSPDSDSSFYSPRTPSSGSSMDMEVDPSSAKSGPHSHQPPSKHQLPPHPTTARKMMNAAAQFSTIDLLRAFPIPRLMSTSSA